MMADAPKYDYDSKESEKKKGKTKIFSFTEADKLLEHVQQLEQCQTVTEH